MFQWGNNGQVEEKPLYLSLKVISVCGIKDLKNASLQCLGGKT